MRKPRPFWVLQDGDGPPAPGNVRLAVVIDDRSPPPSPAMLERIRQWWAKIRGQE